MLIHDPNNDPTNQKLNFEIYSPSQDRRYLPRWEVENRIMYRKKDDVFYHEALTKDFNCSGLCLNTKEDIALNQEVTLTLYLAEDVTVHLKGIVSWQKHTEHGYLAGVQFDNISKKAQDLLLEYAFQSRQQELKKHWFQGWAGS